MIYAKQGVDCLTPYIAGKSISEVQREYGLSEVVKLASNENPLGCSPLAQRAIRDMAAEAAIYPDGGCHDLRMRLADELGVDSAMLVFGTGSDGLIELVGKTFLDRGDNAVMSEKTFSLYHTNTVAAGAAPVTVPLRGDFVMDTAAIARAVDSHTRVVWLCNPNNPTGTVYTQAEQEALLDAVPSGVLVVVDEAYYEYACGQDGYPDTLAAVQVRPNVLVLRTFSKIHGLAGLRVGYGIGHPDIIRQMERVRAPFNVNSFAQAAALASLDDPAFREQSLACNREGYTYLTAGLKQRGLRFLPSSTNFLMVDTGRDSRAVFEGLLRHGVIVKAGAGFGMDTFLRVTIGTQPQCEAFLRALDGVFAE